MANAAQDVRIEFSPLKLRPFLELAREAALPLDAILAAHGTSEAEMLRPETRLPRLQCVAIMRALFTHFDDPLIGLRASERATLKDIDVLGYLAQQCPTALAALEAIVKYARLIGDASDVSLERTRDRVIVRVGLIGGRRSMPELADFAVGSGHVSLLQLSGGSARALRVELARPRPTNPRAYRDFFAAPVVFGARCGAIVYAESSLLGPLPRSDARLAAILRAQAEARLQALPTLQRLTEQVRAQLSRGFERGKLASLAEIADALRMSERTLRRRLRQQSGSFRSLLDDLRRERAKLLLEANDLGVGEIAFQLGFGDATSFGRAFRRWLGTSPAQYRAQSRQGN